MERFERHHKIFPSVVKSGENTTVTIAAIGDHYRLKSGIDYTVEFCPMEQREMPRNRDFVINRMNRREITVRAEDGTLCFSHVFCGEQEWILIVRDEGRVIAKVHLYSLEQDLYERKVFRGDLHLHTTGSDGEDEPVFMASAFREHGFDFIAITDHHKYTPSLEAIHAFTGLPTDFKLFPGEEVHNRGMGYFHIVNFNGKYSINEIILNDVEGILAQVREQAKELDVPEGIDPVEFAYRKWICDHIRESGGLAIFPHPYWTYEDEYHTERKMSEYMFETGCFDAFEVLSDTVEHWGNNLQAAMYQEMRAKGHDCPIVGSSDAHSCDTTRADNKFNLESTLVFARDSESIPEAILEKMSVAVEQLPGLAEPHAIGPFRLLRYTGFLMKFYFPTHHAICKMEGYWLKQLFMGNNKRAKEAIALTRDELRSYEAEFFGR